MSIKTKTKSTATKLHRFHTLTKKVRFAKITPAMAGNILEHFNFKNRTLSETRAKRYAAEMTKGRWSDDSACLYFDNEGNLLNGQKTLRAIELSGVTMSCVVVTGVPVNTMEGLDRGENRSLKNILQLKGKDADSLATKTCNTLARINAGNWSRKPIDSDVYDVAEDKLDAINEIISFMKGQPKYKTMGGFLAAMVMYYEKDKAKALRLLTEYSYDATTNLPAQKLSSTFARWSSEKKNSNSFGRDSYELAVGCIHVHHFNREWPLKGIVVPTDKWEF